MAGKGDIVEQALKLVMGGGGDDAAKVALRQSAQQATDIPAHLRPGFKVEAAPGADDETRNLVDYLSQRDPSLSFDPQSLAERREDLGVTVPGFHGSPRNIERFTNQYSSPEGYWGGHHYFTTSPVDASVNYATPEGADLFRRLEGSVERTLDNFHPGDVTEWYAGKYGSSEGINPVDPKIVKEYADDIARQELGITNEGAVYPVNLRMKNPVKIDSPNQTFWGYDIQRDEAGDIVSEGGPAADLIQATRDALADYNVRDREAGELVGKLYETAVDYGGIDAKSYNDILRGSHMDLYDEDGNMVSMGHVMADAFRRMGHDSIDMPTDVFAGGLGRVGMAGTGGDTRHYIIFDPKNVRSRFGAFDPFKAASERISDAEGGAIEGNDDIDDAIRVAKGGGGGFTKIVRSLFGPVEKEGLEALTKAGSGYKGIPGKPDVVKIPLVGEVEAKPLRPIEQAAETYMQRLGRPGAHKIDVFDPLDEELAAKVAEEYGKMKHAPTDPAVKRAYDALAQETLDQLEAAKGAGIDFTFVKGEDPYKLSPSLGYADLAERGHMYVFPTEQGFGSDVAFDPANNPLLKRIGKLGDLDDATVNDAFRIVHDLYGHYGPGNPFFRAPGEERAFKLHSKMYSPEALPAMASETRGQNSWLNFGPYGRYNRAANAAETIYADQKTGIMPPWTYEKAIGGAIDDAIRIAKDVGGSASAPVMMEDAKGNKYDAQGNIIPPTNPTGSSHISDPTLERKGMIDVGEPANYETEVKPFIDVATSPMNWAEEYPERYSDLPVGTGTVQGNEPTLLDTMKIATQLAASGQPTDERGEHNWGRGREEAVRRFVGAPEGGEEAPYRGPFTYNPSDTASYINTLVGFSPVGWAELFHDVPYEAKRTGDYGTAAYEGGINAVLSAPGMAALGLAGRAGLNALRRNPKLAAGLIGSAAFIDPNEAEAGPARWFSKAMEVARALPMEKMTGQQALAMLRKSVSPEELRWTGADVFLPQQKQITKQDLVDYLAKNRVQPKEIVLGGPDITSIDDDILSKYTPKIERLNSDKKRIEDELAKLVDAEGNISLEDFDKHDKLTDDIQALNLGIQKTNAEMKKEQAMRLGASGRPAKFQDYSTAGGEGYRETLYQLGGQSAPAKVVRKGPMWHIINDDGETLRNQSGRPYTYYTQNDAERAARSIYRTSGSYQSPHWDDPDVFAHTRSNTLTYEPPGANRPYKVHNVEETQSDLAQAGRKQGFKDPEAMARVAKLREQYNELQRRAKDEGIRLHNEHYANLKPFKDAHEAYRQSMVEKYKNGEISLGDMNRAIDENYNQMHLRMDPLVQSFVAKRDELIKPLNEQLSAIGSEIERAGKNIGPMPLMPYVGSTEGWTDFAIKKELDKALDSDADYFSWSPGDVHAERYSLDKHIDEVTYNPSDGTFKAYDKRGRAVVNEYDVPPEKLDDYVGKELADKMRAEDAAKREAYLREWSITEEPDGEFALRRNGKLGWGAWPTKAEAEAALNNDMINAIYRDPMSFSGVDLKMGGEGMRGYYDKIYLKRVQDVIKKSTGIKPEIETITVNTADGPRQQLGVRITDEMREKARFSDFNKGGRVADPVVNKALSLTR